MMADTSTGASDSMALATLEIEKVNQDASEHSVTPGKKRDAQTAGLEDEPARYDIPPDLRTLLDTLNSLEQELEATSLEPRTDPTTYPLSDPGTGPVERNMLVGSHECECIRLREEKSILEVELSNLRWSFDSLKTKYDALSDAYASVVADVSSHQARISALQRTVDHGPADSGPSSLKPSMKRASTSSTQYVREELSSKTYNSDGMEDSSSLSSISGSTGSDADSSEEISFKAPWRALPDTPPSAEDQSIMDAVLRPPDLLQDSVKHKLSIRKVGRTRWNSKQLPYFIVHEGDPNIKMAAYYLPNEDADCGTHFNVFSLKPQATPSEPFQLDRSSSARKVPATSLKLTPIIGNIEEHGILMGPSYNKKSGDLVHVKSYEDGKVKVMNKGIQNGRAAGPFSIYSIAMCIMDSPM